MRLIVCTSPNEVELNYMWLPTWIGMSSQVKAEIEKLLQPKLVGMPLDDVTLDWAHDQVIEFLETKYPHIEGLRAFLEGLKHIPA